jgi:hypothetical protein
MTPIEPINTDVATDEDDDGMRAEYDFSNGVRGKHAAAYAKGIEVRVDGEPRVVMVTLDPDVAAVFSNSQSVNDALRLLIKVAKRALDLQKAS